MLHANFKTWVFNLFSKKALVSEQRIQRWCVYVVQQEESSMTWAGEGKSPLSKLGAQPRCGIGYRVAVCLRKEAQAGARRSGGGRLHSVGQITRRLSNVYVVHEGAKLVGDSVTNWQPVQLDEAWRHMFAFTKVENQPCCSVLYTCCNGSIVDCGRAARTELTLIQPRCDECQHQTGL